METYAKKLSIQLDINDFDEQKVLELQELLRVHPGTNNLNFIVYDTKEKIKVTMPSRIQKVKISQELLHGLTSYDVRYKLN